MSDFRLQHQQKNVTNMSITADAALHIVNGRSDKATSSQFSQQASQLDPLLVSQVSKPAKKDEKDKDKKQKGKSSSISCQRELSILVVDDSKTTRYYDPQA